MKFTKKCFIALGSFVVLMLQAFGLKFDLPVVNEAIASVASLLVMLGIISDSKPKAEDTSTKTLEEEKEADEDSTEDNEEETE